MTEQKDNSSLPLLLAISAAVVLSAAIGWLIIDQELPIPAVPDEVQPATPTETPVEPSVPVLTGDIDATFRKARLAADADMLANPVAQNALYFYGRILAIEPDNAIAEAELDAVISRLSAIINTHMTAAEFDDAHELAIKIAEVHPTSRFVQDIEKQLDDLATEYVATAMQHAQAGNERAAANAIAAAEALPARESDYLTAVRTSMAEIAATRRAAEDKIIADTEQAVALATANSVARVRDAIALGQLITPPDANARSYLAEAEIPAEQRAELTRELVTALTDAAKSNFEPGQLPNAETFLDAAGEIAADDAELGALHISAEQDYIEAESNRRISTRQLEHVKVVQPVYPSRALQIDVTGWVELAFTVTSSGATADIEILQSNPERIFDGAAIRAVEQWAFEPRVIRGQTVDQRVGVRLVFEIE